MAPIKKNPQKKEKAKKNTSKVNSRLTKIKAQATNKKFNVNKNYKNLPKQKHQNTKSISLNFALSAFSVFIFVILFEYIWHDVILKELYFNNQHLWRNANEINHYLKFTLLTQGSLAILFTIIFSHYHSNKALGKGLQFGFLTGLFLAITQTAPYANMPIAGDLAFLWFVGGLLQGIGIGLVLACIYKK